MWNPLSRSPHPSWADPEGLVNEIMENAAAASSADSTMISMDPCISYSPTAYLEGLTAGGNFVEDTGPPNITQRVSPLCYTPPDSVQSATTPSPSGVQTDATVSGHQGDNFDCTPLIVSHLRKFNATMAAPTQPSPPRVNGAYLSASVPVNGRIEDRLVAHARLASRRPQLISAQCSQASIEVLNPKEEYDKIQKKHGPKGKISEQRVSNGQVEMRIKSHQQLAQLAVYVQREPEAEKKLTQKDPHVYGLGPTKLNHRLQVTDVSRSDLEQEQLTYICKFDLDCVYKTPHNKEVYRLEKTRGTEYNRFQLKVYLQFVDGSHEVLFPYEFVLKSGKTGRCPPTTSLHRPSPFAGSPSSAAGPSQQDPSDALYSRLMCQQLEAEFAKIKTLEVEQIQTANHDIAYYIKRKNPDERYEEGDVVGFFESRGGDTVIDLLTSENAHEAGLAGVISRSAYLIGNTGRYDNERNDADLVCIIGEIKVKVVGKVKAGELIYTCPSDKFPGTATTRRHHGNRSQTLLGYAMGESSSSGLSKVDCIVSLVLSVGATERLRELDQVRRSIKEVRENLEVHIDNVGHRITRMQRGWRGIWKKLLGITLFLVAVSIVCGLMLPPNSPYVKKKCREGSISGHYLTFTYYPSLSEDGIPVEGLEFTWKNLKKKLNLKFDEITNGTGYRYFLNKGRCETGGIRAIASWLDPAPTYPHVNVLAVDAGCKRVYYHSKKKGDWFEYRDAGDIQCQPPA